MEGERVERYCHVFIYQMILSTVTYSSGEDFNLRLQVENEERVGGGCRGRGWGRWRGWKSERGGGGGGKGWGVVKWGEEHEQREAESQRHRVASRSLQP